MKQRQLKKPINYAIVSHWYVSLAGIAEILDVPVKRLKSQNMRPEIIFNYQATNFKD